MNFLNKVIFGNKNKNNKKKTEDDLEFEQYSSFRAEASFLELSGNKKEMIFEDCNVSFLNDSEH
jgi:hypothetical protein